MRYFHEYWEWTRPYFFSALKLWKHLELRFEFLHETWIILYFLNLKEESYSSLSLVPFFPQETLIIARLFVTWLSFFKLYISIHCWSSIRQFATDHPSNYLSIYSLVYLSILTWRKTPTSFTKDLLSFAKIVKYFWKNSENSNNQEIQTFDLL